MGWMSRVKSMVPSEGGSESGASAPSRLVHSAPNTNAALQTDRPDPGGAGTVGGQPDVGRLAAGNGAWRRMRGRRINTEAWG